MASTSLKIAHIIVLIIYAVATLVFSILSFSQVNEKASAAIDIVDNWKTKSVLDISVAQNCPQRYEEAFNYTWPGNDAGCFCQNISGFSKAVYSIDKGIYKDACTQNQTDAGCVNVMANPPTDVSSWGRVDNNRVKVCVLRSNESWADVASKSGANCSERGATKCGTNPETAFCTKDRCPIGDITVASLSSTADLATLAACTYDKGCLVLSKDGRGVKVLRFNRADQSEGLPLAQMRLNEYGMCKTIGDDNITPNRTEFYLLKEKRSTCGDEGNALWQVQDTMTEDDLFAKNALTPVTDYLSKFGYYPKSTSGKDYKWNLYSRSYIPWKIACRGEMGALVAKSYGIGSLKTAEIVQLVVASIANFILGIILPIFIIGGKCHKFTKIFNWVGKLVQVPFQIISLIIASSIHTFFTSFVLNNCSDPPVLQILADAGIGAKNAYDENIKGLVFFVLAIIFDIGCLLYKRVKGEESEAYYPQVNIEASVRARDEAAAKKNRAYQA